MEFRVKIITPIQVDGADLERRRARYGERAAANTKIDVIGLNAGPCALETVEDIRASESAVFEQAIGLDLESCDALLVDCIFDPGVEALHEALPIPVFGPLRTALSQLPVIAPNFGMVTRAQGHGDVFRGLIEGYGFAEQLVAIRTLALPYQQARKPENFDSAMRKALKAVVEEDGARAVVMGSTTMALAPDVAQVGGGIPLLLTGMMTLGIMESLWRDDLH